MSETSVALASRYRLDAQIASGGIGEVWRARDLVLDRPVAVKLLRSEYAGQPQVLSRFRAEARQAGSMSHPGIAQVYDYGEAGPGATPYLVMELVNGPSLADVLAAGPLDAASAMDVLAQTAAGLQAAHAAGLVHRDIKPANLVIAPGGQVKITDFGIAHATGAMPVTRTGVVIGTPAYLAPEQIAGDRASPASDLYALGVVGYECLTGMPPFRGAPIEVAAAHRDRPLPPLPASVPAAAASLVAELTRKDPAARPAAAADVAARASQLRDAFAGGAATALAEIARSPVRSSVAAAHPATLVDANPPTWHGPHQQAWTAAQRPTWQGAYGRPGPRSGRWPPDRSRRHGLLAATAVVLVAALGVLVLVAILPGIRGSPSVSRPSREVQTVRVNDSALVGEPVSKVTKSLRQLGLTPTIAWTSSSGQDGQDPGTVISVDPSGFVPAGSTVIVTAVFPMPGSGHGHNNGGDGGNGG